MSIRRLTKGALFTLCQYSGVNWLCRQRLRHQLLVLCYHGVISNPRKDPFGYGNTVHRKEFQQQLEYLTRHFRPVSARDVVAARYGGQPLPESAVLVTFDDGYRNNFTQAAEILLQVGVPCVFHVSTGYIGTNRILWTDEIVGRILKWPSSTLPLPGGGTKRLSAQETDRRVQAWRIKEGCKKIPVQQLEAYLNLLRQATPNPESDDELHAFMNWEQVRKLHQQGFEIGSHTIEHPILTQIPAERLQIELTASKERIEKEIRSPCTCIAYPNGGPNDVSSTVCDAARTAGYKLGFTVAERPSGPEDALAISRLCIQGHLPPSVFPFRVNGVEWLMFRHVAGPSDERSKRRSRSPVNAAAATPSE
jgi:peptidoglycan/xylan/chitin deacetylase (PgdA/CDA1 family)